MANKIKPATKVAKRNTETKKTTEAKAVAKKITEPKEVAKTKASKTKAVEPVKKTPTVALAINKTFCGLNLFFDKKESKTIEDSNFMKSEMKMRWNGTDKCWYVKFKSKDQLDRVLKHFGDRLWTPEDLDSQVSEVLKTASKTEKRQSPAISFATLVKAN